MFRKCFGDSISSCLWGLMSLSTAQLSSAQLSSLTRQADQVNKQPFACVQERDFAFAKALQVCMATHLSIHARRSAGERLANSVQWCRTRRTPGRSMLQLARRTGKRSAASAHLYCPTGPSCRHTAGPAQSARQTATQQTWTLHSACRHRSCDSSTCSCSTVRLQHEPAATPHNNLKLLPIHHLKHVHGA